MKHRYPEHFTRLNLYYAAVQLIGAYHYRFPIRKFILEIFEVKFDADALRVLDAVGAEDRDRTNDGTDDVFEGDPLAPPSRRPSKTINGGLSALDGEGGDSARPSPSDGALEIITSDYDDDNYDDDDNNDSEYEEDLVVPKEKLVPQKVIVGFDAQ